MKQSYSISAILLLFCTMQMYSMEMASTYIENAKKLYAYYRGYSEYVEFKKHDVDAVTSMIDFVQTGIDDIDARVNPQETKQLFQTGIFDDVEMVSRDWEHEDVGQRLEQLYKEAINSVAFSFDKHHLKDLSTRLISLKDDLEAHREGMPFIVHRCGNTVDVVMRNISDSLKSLQDAAKKSGYDVYKAYEILGFDPKKRSQITPDTIRKEYERLGKKYKGTQTPLGSAVRQAGYILQSPFGKQNYDAFLSDYLNPKLHNGSIQSLVITDNMAALLKIDYGVFNEFITQSKYFLDELNKSVLERLAKLS